MDNTILQLSDNSPMDDNQADLAIQQKLQELVDWQKLKDTHFIAQVERGRLGGNVGLDNGMNGLNKYIYGTHPGRYYLIGADSGVGKTTLGDFMFVMKAYESAKAKNRKLYILYYSFEISLEEKQARWASYYIYQQFGVMIPADYIQGRITGMMVNEEHMHMIRHAYLYIEELMQCVRIVEDSTHPTKIFHDVIDHHYDIIGTVVRKASHDPKKRGPIERWVPHPGEENSITILMIDHIALLASEQGFDPKQTIDLMSRYCVTLRNIFKTTPVIIQQFNTEITSMYRMSKKGDPVIKPQRIDFGDSRYTFRDANIVLGVIKPAIYDIPKYYNYDISKLKGWMVGVHLMKNRHGSSQRMLPVFLNGLVGVAEDLPFDATVDLAMEPYYEQAFKLEQICQLYSPKNP